MSPFLKKFLIVVIGLIVLVGGALAAVALTFDPNDYKEDIQAQVKKQTGRDLTLGGDLELSVFPWLGVEANTLSLSNAQGFEDAEFAQIEHVQARLRLMPLLKGRIELGKIALHGLVLNLQRKADGSTNWDDLAGGAAAESAPAEDPVEVKGEVELDELSIAGLELVDARLKWRDADQLTVVDGLNLETGPISLGQPSTFALSVVLTLADQTRLELQAESGWQFELEGPFARLQDFTATAKASGDAVPGGSQQLELTLDAAYNGTTQSAAVSDAELRFVDQVIQLSAELEELDSVQHAKLDVKGQQVDVRRIAKALEVELPDEASNWPTLSFALMADASLGRDRVEMATLDVGFGELKLAASTTLNSIANQTGRGSVSLKALDLHAYLAALGYPIGVPNSPGPTQLDMNFAIAPDRVAIESINGKLAGEALSGNASVANFSKPQLRANLDLAGFTVRDWVGGSDTEASPSSKPESSGGDINSMEVPMDWARDLNLTARVQISRFNAYGLKFRDVRWTADARPGTPVKQQLVANAYGGQLALNNSIDASKPKPVLGVDLSAKAVGLGDFLQDGWGSRWITGTTELGLNLESQGATVGAMRSSANGAASYKLKDGEVQGISLVDLVRKASALAGGEKAQAAESGESTAFSELVGRFLIQSGKLKVQQLGGNNRWFQFGGDGFIDLLAGQFDLTLAPKLLENETTRNDKTLSKLIGLAIPVEVSGPLTKPRFKVSLDEVLKQKARAELQSEVDEKKEELKEKLNEKLGDFFRRQQSKSEATEQPAAGDAQQQ